MTSTRTIGIAIAIPEPWGSELQAWRARFGDPLAQVIPTHVTLLPPIEVEPAALPGIEQHLSAVASDALPFSMVLRGTGSFRPLSPVVFVQVAEGISVCEVLHREVCNGPLRRELKFPYHPHVTVAHDLDDTVLDHASAGLADYEARFEISGFSLYEHGPDGVWRPQRDYAFGGPLPQPARSA